MSDARLTFNYLSIVQCKVCVNDLLAGLGQDNSGIKILNAAPYKCTKNMTAAKRINSSSFPTTPLEMKLCCHFGSQEGQFPGQVSKQCNP